MDKEYDPFWLTIWGSQWTLWKCDKNAGVSLVQSKERKHKKLKSTWWKKKTSPCNLEMFAVWVVSSYIKSNAQDYFCYSYFYPMRVYLSPSLKPESFSHQARNMIKHALYWHGLMRHRGRLVEKKSTVHMLHEMGIR